MVTLQSVQPAGAGDTLGTTTPQNQRPRLLTILQYAMFPIAALAVWQVLSVVGFVRRNVLPPPLDVLTVWYDLIAGTSGDAGRYSGTWVSHAWASTWRVFAGFAWGVALGTLLGLLIGLSRLMERVFDPTLQILRSIPVTAWVPLSLVFFGIGNAPAIFLIGLGAFFPAAINSTHGVRQVNATLYKAARMMGADQRELLVKVIIPAALPSIMNGLRLSMGISWVLVVVAEILAVKSGLGYLLNDAYLFYRNDVMISAMLSIGLLGFLCDRLIVFVRSRLLTWNTRESFDGEH